MSQDFEQWILEKVRACSTAGQPVYLVGGVVRDRCLNRRCHDLDFVMPGSTRKLARAVADALKGAFYVMDEQRDTTRVVLQSPSNGHWYLDFASIRAGDLEGDLRARDFTVNAMAVDIMQSDRLIDPLNGLADLRAGVLRACSPTSLSDDPARVLRAVRQALSLRFRIDPETVRLVCAAAPLLGRVSPERRRDELFRILAGRQVSQAIQLLDHVGALEQTLPELLALKGERQSAPHVHDIWEHTLAVASHLERLFDALVGDYNEDAGADLMMGLAVMRLGRYREAFARHFSRSDQPDRPVRALLFLAALYHDIAKPATRSLKPGEEGRFQFLGHHEEGAEVAAQRGRALMLSSDEIQRLESVVRCHMRVHWMADSLAQTDGKIAGRSVYRYFRAAGESGVDVCLLSAADTRGTYETTLPLKTWTAELDVCRILLEAYWEKSEAVVSPPRLLNGNELMAALGLKPGRLVGKILEVVREGQAAGEIHDREEALELARQWMMEGRAGQEEEG